MDCSYERCRDSASPSAITLPARPHEIVLAVEFESGCIDGPPVAGIADLALEGPVAPDGIVTVVLDNINSMRQHCRRHQRQSRYTTCCPTDGVREPIIPLTMDARFGRPHHLRFGVRRSVMSAVLRRVRSVPVESE